MTTTFLQNIKQLLLWNNLTSSFTWPNKSMMVFATFCERVVVVVVMVGGGKHGVFGTKRKRRHHLPPKSSFHTSTEDVADTWR